MNLLWLRPGGGHLGKIGYGDVQLVRVPFSGSKNLWQGRKITKFQKVYLTGSTFCEFWHFIGLTSKIFQISYLTGSKFRLLGYEFCQKLVSDRVHFSNSSGTSPSVVKVSAPRGLRVLIKTWYSLRYILCYSKIRAKKIVLFASFIMLHRLY